MLKITLVIMAFLGLGLDAWAQQIPTKFIQDLAITPGKMSCGAATATYVATCDGSGNVSFAAAAAGGTRVQEIPSGSGTAFTLAHTPLSNAAVLLFVNGLFLRQGTDYTITGTSITLTDSLVAGQTIDASYIY